MSEISIGSHIISDHAPVLVKWCSGDSRPRAQEWRLHNSLLQVKKITDKIEEEIPGFFSWKKDSAATHIVWDTFKAYL